MPLDQMDVRYNDRYTPEKEMSFLEHLEELRWHIMRATIAIVTGMIVAFIFIRDIFQSVILAPSRPDFWTYKMMCKLGTKINVPALCIDKLNFELQSRDMSGQFMMSITSSLIVGLLVAFPYAFWEVWRFIKPGLQLKEQKAARGAVFYVSLLFFLGVLFGYYIVSPLAINFLANYQIDPSIKNFFDISSYISVLSTLVLACGIMFQMPIVVFVLTRVGILSARFMREYRRHAVVVIMLVAAIITPSPDPFSMIIVSIPLYLLYEISIGIAARVEKLKTKNNLALENV